MSSTTASERDFIMFAAHSHSVLSVSMIKVASLIAACPFLTLVFRDFCSVVFGLLVGCLILHAHCWHEPSHCIASHLCTRGLILQGTEYLQVPPIYLALRGLTCKDQFLNAQFSNLGALICICEAVMLPTICFRCQCVSKCRMNMLN